MYRSSEKPEEKEPILRANTTLMERLLLGMFVLCVLFVWVEVMLSISVGGPFMCCGMVVGVLNASTFFILHRTERSNSVIRYRLQQQQQLLDERARRAIEQIEPYERNLE